MTYSPRYSISGLFVAVGPHVDMASHEKLLSGTFGSTDWLWSGDDEFRFDKETRELSGVILTTPEEGPVGSWTPAAWLALPYVPGGLRAENTGNFDARPMATRWVSEDGGWMACATTVEATPSTALLRLRVAECLDFVFADGVLVGWILESPARFLVRKSDIPPENDCGHELNEALRDFLSILTEPNIEALQDGDPIVYSSLADLRMRLTLMPVDTRRDVLIERIDDLVEEWPQAR